MSDQSIASAPSGQRMKRPTGLALTWYNLKRSLMTPMPYLTFVGLALWIFTYWLLSEGLEVWRFAKIPGPVTVLT
ncbi:MAG: hypothetical protein ACR2OM_02920, partial [Aestuariivirgaceae bacterium]